MPCNIVKEFRNFCSDALNYFHEHENDKDMEKAALEFQAIMTQRNIDILNLMRNDLGIKEEIYDFRNERH